MSSMMPAGAAIGPACVAGPAASWMDWAAADRMNGGRAGEPADPPGTGLDAIIAATPKGLAGQPGMRG